MPSRLPVTIDFGTLPQNGQGYTPQQFANILGTNGAIFTEQEFALFVTGSTAPTSDVGPWLANGNEWRVWSDDEGAYVPITIDQASLGYVISETAPDPDVYQFWIKTTAGGSPLGLFTYYSGSWVDVYAATIGGYMTVAAFNTAIADYSTTAQMNTAISDGDSTTLTAANDYTDAAIAGIPAGMNTVPGTGRLNAAQSIPADGTDVVMTIDSAPINGDGAISIADNAYIAPATGTYHFDVWTQFDNDDAAAAGVEIEIGLYIDGAFANQGDGDGTPSPNGARWSPGMGGLISLAAGEKLTCVVRIEDGVGTGFVDLTTWQLAVHRVK